jgi:hypothetical protein
MFEYLLKADRRLGLDDPGRAREWLTNYLGWLWPQEVDDDGARHPSSLVWPEFEKNWAASLRALRTVAHAAGVFKLKHVPAFAKFMRGQVVMRHYLRMVRLQDDPAEGKKQKIAGVSHYLTQPRKAASGAVEWSVIPHGRELEHYDTPEVYWQAVFYSLFSTSLPGVCRQCGRPLPRTRKGKPGRGSICRRCSHKKWESQQDPEKLREKAAQRKAAQRERELKARISKSKNRGQQ